MRKLNLLLDLSTRIGDKVDVGLIFNFFIFLIKLCIFLFFFVIMLYGGSRFFGWVMQLIMKVM